MIPVREIRQSACPARREFAYDGLLALAQSIGENGMLNPLTVTFEGDCPVLVAGQRRLRAAKIAGLREVPCLVLPADHKRAAVLALAENMQRQPLTCFEQAAALRGMMRRFRLDEDEAARLLGCTPAAVTQMLQLLALSPREQATLTEHGLGAPHARRPAGSAAAADDCEKGTVRGRRAAEAGAKIRAAGGAGGAGYAVVFQHAEPCGGYHAPQRY